MARRCELTGKGPMFGNHVSHAQNKRRRRFLPNLNRVALFSDELRTLLRFRASAAALRSVEHIGGIDAFLLKVSSTQLSRRARNYKKQIAQAKQKT